MIKVGKAWSWFVEKIRGSESSQKSGPPYRPLPEIPEPKPRSKARYSVVLINEAGRSRQIEVSPVRLGLGVAAVCGVFLLMIVAAGTIGGFLRGGPESTGDREALTAKLAALEEDLRQKELALAVQEKRLKEMQELPRMDAALSRESEAARSEEMRSPGSIPRESDHGPLTAMKPAERGSGIDRDDLQAVLPGSESEDAQPGGEPGSPGYTEREIAESAGDTPSEVSRSDRTREIIEFNAEEVVAIAKGPNSGRLRFKLVKNRHGTRFSGYLFVYVEMEDQRGVSRLYAYPKEARRGEEDLPTDFREGKSVAFNKNSLVELPYDDNRPGASLSGVSILIYDPDGKIVFQRRFDDKDLKVVDSRSHDGNEVTPVRGDGRRPL
ncbi:MAG: hypothetical protein RDU20_13450 [Desulfomonilaceae bacterium]|nr:hypothetical protein [Desulfomonilaceae bacterium]